MEIDKKFLLRNIPPELHVRWKTAAAQLGVSMGDFALASLDRGCGEVEKLKDAEARQAAEG